MKDLDASALCQIPPPLKKSLKQNTLALLNLYRGPVIDYTRDNWEACKTQLLNLLLALNQLDPKRYGIFKTFYANVQDNITSGASMICSICFI